MLFVARADRSKYDRIEVRKLAAQSETRVPRTFLRDSYPAKEMLIETMLVLIETINRPVIIVSIMQQCTASDVAIFMPPDTVDPMCVFGNEE